VPRKRIGRDWNKGHQNFLGWISGTTKVQGEDKLLIKQKPWGIRMMGGKHMGLKKVDSPHLDAEQKY